MSTQRKALVVFGVCAVLYLVALPALPDTGGTADDLVWLLGLIVAVLGVGALVVAYRAHRADQRHSGQQRGGTGAGPGQSMPR